jgi:predicted small metal-binding protein
VAQICASKTDFFDLPQRRRRQLTEVGFSRPGQSRTTAAKTGMFILPSGGPVMTKVLRCNDMMPGCDYVARAETEDELMQKAAQHAREKHGMQTVPPEVAQQIKSKIRDE